MNVPGYLDIQSLPKDFTWIATGEEADIIKCREPIDLPKSAQPFDFHFSESPPQGKPLVITQFHTNFNTARVTTTLGGPVSKLVYARDLFGFVSPEGIQRLAGIFRLANILSDHVVPVFGCAAAPSSDRPLFYTRETLPKNEEGIPQPPCLYKGYVEVPEEDRRLMQHTYGEMLTVRQEISRILGRLEGRSPSPNDLDLLALKEVQRGFQLAMDGYEKTLLEKYKGPFAEALSDLADIGFGVVHPGMNFGYALNQNGSGGNVVFFELSSLVDYKRLTEVVRGIKDSSKRMAAGSVLGEVIRLEEKALEKVIGWCDQRIIGRNSNYDKLPGIPSGRIPFPIGNTPQEFHLDDGTMLRQWVRGLRNLRIENPDVIPKKPGDPLILDPGGLLIQPDYSATYRRDLGITLNKR